MQLTGWSGAKPEEIVSQAAGSGFNEIIVGNHDPQYLGQLVSFGQKHEIGIYASICFGDVNDWKKRRPGVNPPLQAMNAEENDVLNDPATREVFRQAFRGGETAGEARANEHGLKLEQAGP